MSLSGYGVILSIIIVAFGCNASATSGDFSNSSLGVIAKKHESEKDAYARELLRLALEQTSYDATSLLTPVNLPNPQSKASLESGSTDLVWTAAHNLPSGDAHHIIRIPIFRGLLSYYSVIYHKASAINVAKSGFGNHEIGMLRYDALTESLQAQGFNIVTTRAVQSLVQMLNQVRFEAMLAPTAEVTGLSVTEAYQTPQQITRLYNPWYFVVHKDKPELARALELGLHRILNDGSLDNLMARTQWMQDLKNHLAAHQSFTMNLGIANQYKPGTEDTAGFWVAWQAHQASADQLVSASF